MRHSPRRPCRPGLSTEPSKIGDQRRQNRCTCGWGNLWTSLCRGPTVSQHKEASDTTESSASWQVRHISDHRCLFRTASAGPSWRGWRPTPPGCSHWRPAAGWRGSLWRPGARSQHTTSCLATSLPGMGSPRTLWRARPTLCWLPTGRRWWAPPRWWPGSARPGAGSSTSLSSTLTGSR